MSIQITINSVDYTAYIGDPSFSIKESKSTAKNIKGDALTIPPRSQNPRCTVKVPIYYVARSVVDALNTLYKAGQPIPATFTGLDIPSGNYVISECTWQLVKNLTNIIYNVSVTLQQDLPATSPNPVNTSSVALIQAAIPLILGV